MRLKALGRVDSEEREVRFIDQFQYFTWLIIVACLVGMALWVHHIGDNVTAVGSRLSREQAKVNAEAQRLGADRAQLINGCRRINRLLVSGNTSSAGNYTVFRYLLAVYNESPAAVKREPVNVEFDQRLKKASAAQSWTPKTNCQRLIEQEGARYRLPPAVPFDTREAPSSQLLHPSQSK